MSDTDPNDKKTAMTTFKLITFDCYSALFDYRGSLVPVVADVLHLEQEQAAAVLGLWRTKQLEAAALSNSLGKARVSFRDCTRLSLDYAARRYALSLSSAQHTELVDAWDRLRPWPEANGVLRRIKAKGCRIALLSNGDQAMLEALADNLEVAVDGVLSSQTCGRYKPDPIVYRLPTDELGVEITQYLHVAGGAGDVVGAKAAGVTCYWSNRSDDSVLMPAYAPDFTGDSLEGVPAVVS